MGHKLGEAYTITSIGLDVLEEHRRGILEWIEYAVRGREDVASLLRWMRSLPARKGLVLHLVQRLQCSDDPGFREALVDVALKAHPDRGLLLGHLMAEAEDEEGGDLCTIHDLMLHESVATTEKNIPPNRSRRRRLLERLSKRIPMGLARETD